MAYNKFDPGCCCSGCPTIGFDVGVCLTFSGCCSPMSPLVNLKDDTSRLGECAVVFGGNCFGCGEAMQFNEADWPTLKTYIRAGGRLFITAENQATSTILGPPFCFPDAAKTKLNNFLDALGTSIRYAGGEGYIGATGPAGADNMTPGAAHIAQGLPNCTSNLFGEIKGGVPVWKLDAYKYSFITPVTRGDNVGIKTIMAVDPVGSGFVFVTGDANHGGPGWCDFVKRLWEYGNDQIV